MSNVEAWAAPGVKQKMVLTTIDLGPLDDVEVEVEYCGLCHSYQCWMLSLALISYELPLEPADLDTGQIESDDLQELDIDSDRASARRYSRSR